ncbi:VWA domain-containing protein [Tenacibaculum dicentrarchi]|nr:VWA domain-containing protein [Tenacibaculum dicentrarchi]
MKNLNELIIQKARPLPVIILADISGSMASDNRIGVLNNAIREMIDSLKDEGTLRAEIYFSVITFGGNVKSHIGFTKANEINWNNLNAGGNTPMGEAFSRTKLFLEDKDQIPSRSYAPTLVLLSDGGPTDDWSTPLNELLNSPRASKAIRLAMSIGAGQSGKNVLKQFLGDSELEVFEADQAREIKKFFRFVTMSISQRAKSVNPNHPVTVNFDDSEEDLDDFEF